MKAWFLTANNTFEFKEIDEPQPKNGEVKIKLEAAAFNRRDYWISIGQYAGIKYPSILGSDGCGVISEVGTNVKNFNPGDRVIINPSLNWGNNQDFFSDEFTILGLPVNGVFQESICINQQNIYAAPNHLTTEEAAALPLAGLTAFRALFSRAKLTAGAKILITGIGGGAAQFAFSFAKAVGAEVYVSSGSNDKINKAKANGAAGGFNYKTNDWAKTALKTCGKFDVILDSAAGDGFQQLLELLKPGGTIVFFGGTNGSIKEIKPNTVFWNNLNILGTTMGSDQDFMAMLKFVNQYQIKPKIHAVYDFNKAEKAINLMKNHDQEGKIVLKF